VCTEKMAKSFRQKWLRQLLFTNMRIRIFLFSMVVINLLTKKTNLSCKMEWFIYIEELEPYLNPHLFSDFF